VKAAGIRRFGDAVQTLELPEPRALRPDEVLIEVRACGVGNWDDFARTGDWDLGVRPPMALGVEAAGLVVAAGDRVDGIKTRDRVTAHSAPLREQGAWAGQFIAAAAEVAAMPPRVPFDVAAALPVPALTADQAIRGALQVRAGQTVLVHGAGGVTGGMLVQLAAHRGATVLATAGDEAMKAVGDGGRLATITSDPPPSERGITVQAVLVAPDGRRLGRLVRLLDRGALTVSVSKQFPLEQGGAALAQVRHGAHGTAIVLKPEGAR